MNIRQATSDDSVAISGLMHQLGYETSPDYKLANLRSLQDSALDRVLVAYLGKRVVGVISCHVIPFFHEHGNLGRITSLVIDRECRGEGAGQSLVSAAEAFFSQLRCVRYEVTSGDHRVDAHQFYARCGYVEEERRFIKRVG